VVKLTEGDESSFSINMLALYNLFQKICIIYTYTQDAHFYHVLLDVLPSPNTRKHEVYAGIPHIFLSCYLLVIATHI
jgi:hypothetical protein